ncbi:hypothetical protein HPB49_007565 [Dermacentor silvarum]|uniref:Uncharacterized protein n=1 Tax=Dermacentor silvarum TaxID=543639 RepID=A0ACB8C7Z8_DERSI|nr:hypothetical protein HPB49_007565 [Dermacentor silvarum]
MSLKLQALAGHQFHHHRPTGRAITAQNPFGHTERQPALTKTTASSPRRTAAARCRTTRSPKAAPRAGQPPHRPTGHRNRSRRAIEQFSIMADETSKTTGTGEARSGACQSAARATKKPKPPRQPQLPREDIKIIAEDDIYRSCVEKNVIVISTPRMANAEKYNRIRELQIGDTHYEATAYAAPPADTYKGVIHNIPDYDTAEDIIKSLIYKKNPTILQARRMGNTNSAIIIFEGPNVPFYVYYRGAEYRCYLHKKKVEVCGACGRIGHRADVCPTPDKKQCKDCGAQNPADNHSCNPKCALCGKDHPTGDKSCQRHFRTPFLIKQRQPIVATSSRQAENGSPTPIPIKIEGHCRRSQGIQIKIPIGT